MCMVISGCVGPRGDGYRPSEMMSVVQAMRYHQAQIDTFAGTAADMVSAITMNYVEEAIGVVLAARAAGMPAPISFTVETDGRLPSGQPLGEAIAEVDRATDAYPAYYMVNCAHPEHFHGVLREPWAARIRGLRANASRKSHAELNDSPSSTPAMRRARRAICGAAPARCRAQRDGGLLRHRPPPCRAHRRRLYAALSTCCVSR